MVVPVAAAVAVVIVMAMTIQLLLFIIITTAASGVVAAAMTMWSPSHLGCTGLRGVFTRWTWLRPTKRTSPTKNGHDKIHSTLSFDSQKRLIKSANIRFKLFVSTSVSALMN